MWWLVIALTRRGYAVLRKVDSQNSGARPILTRYWEGAYNLKGLAGGCGRVGYIDRASEQRCEGVWTGDII